LTECLEPHCAGQDLRPNRPARPGGERVTVTAAKALQTD
jgi:hypothetical protein